VIRRVRSSLGLGSGRPPSGALNGLVRRHGLEVLDRQVKLDRLAGDADWWLDQDQGTITLGELVAPVQFIGTEADHPHTWRWAWANPHVDPPLSLRVQELRTMGQHDGVPEFVDAEFPLTQWMTGHAISIAVVGTLEGDAYYRAPYPGGAVFVMLQLTGLDDHGQPSPFEIASTVLTSAPMALPVMPGTEEVAAYLSKRGLQPKVERNSVTVDEDGRTLRVTFDAYDRIASISSDVPHR
jgi:hypothetical protein